MYPSPGAEPRTAPLPEHIDFAAVWADYLRGRPGLRLDATVDRVFWEGLAPHYDGRTALPGSYEQTLDALLALVRPEDTLLDVGTGTGRFAVPLAHVVRHVTALDHAPAMLAVLERKLVAERLSNVTIVETAWEAAEVPPHDVVLAAWSLYRQLDLRSTLEKLVAATRRTLVIIAPDMADPPHRPLVQSILDRDGEPDVPTYLYILGALRQLGVRADLRVVHETRLVVGRSPTELAHQLAPIDGTEADIQRLASGLLPLLQQYGDDWQYAYTFPAAIMTWRPAG